MKGRAARIHVLPVQVFLALSGLLILAACAGVSREVDTSEDIPGPSQSSNAGRVKSNPDLEVEAVSLPDLGAAPELTNEVWFNTTAPLRLQNLKGKVVLLDMWTFG